MKELRDFIKKLLIQHNLYNIPIDIIELAKKEGFDVLQQDLDGYSGAILVDINNKFEIDNKKYNKVILIDNYQGNARKNFTIAHELGHYFMEFSKNNGKVFAHREDETIHEPKERMANDFASELLMPYDMIEKFIREVSKKYLNYNIIVRAIADAFNVSVAAASFRYDKYLRGI